MTKHSTTIRLTTTASALSLGLLLSGSLAMAADIPAGTLSSAPPPAATYPHWTPEQRAQHWAQMQQSARELWAKVDLTPEQRQQYWEQMQQSARELWAKWGLTPEQSQQYLAQMQRGWHDLEAMMKPAVTATAATAATAAAAVAAVAPSAVAAPAATNTPRRVNNVWALWGMTPEQRHQYAEYLQRGGK